MKCQPASQHGTDNFRMDFPEVLGKVTACDTSTMDPDLVFAMHDTIQQCSVSQCKELLDAMILRLSEPVPRACVVVEQLLPATLVQYAEQPCDEDMGFQIILQRLHSVRNSGEGVKNLIMALHEDPLLHSQYLAGLVEALCRHISTGVELEWIPTCVYQLLRICRTHSSLTDTVLGALFSSIAAGVENPMFDREEVIHTQALMVEHLASIARLNRGVPVLILKKLKIRHYDLSVFTLATLLRLCDTLQLKDKIFSLLLGFIKGFYRTQNMEQRSTLVSRIQKVAPMFVDIPQLCREAIQRSRKGWETLVPKLCELSFALLEEKDDSCRALGAEMLQEIFLIHAGVRSHCYSMLEQFIFLPSYSGPQKLAAVGVVARLVEQGEMHEFITGLQATFQYLGQLEAHPLVAQLWMKCISPLILEHPRLCDSLVLFLRKAVVSHSTYLQDIAIQGFMSILVLGCDNANECSSSQNTQSSAADVILFLETKGFLKRVFHLPRETRVSFYNALEALFLSSSMRPSLQYEIAVMLYEQLLKFKEDDPSRKIPFSLDVYSNQLVEEPLGALSNILQRMVTSLEQTTTFDLVEDMGNVLLESLQRLSTASLTDFEFVKRLTEEQPKSKHRKVDREDVCSQQAAATQTMIRNLGSLCGLSTSILSSFLNYGLNVADLTNEEDLASLRTLYTLMRGLGSIKSKAKGFRADFITVGDTCRFMSSLAGCRESLGDVFGEDYDDFLGYILASFIAQCNRICDDDSMEVRVEDFTRLVDLFTVEYNHILSTEHPQESLLVALFDSLAACYRVAHSRDIFSAVICSTGLELGEALDQLVHDMSIVLEQLLCTRMVAAPTSGIKLLHSVLFGKECLWKLMSGDRLMGHCKWWRELATSGEYSLEYLNCTKDMKDSLVQLSNEFLSYGICLERTCGQVLNVCASVLDDYVLLCGSGMRAPNAANELTVVTDVTKDHMLLFVAKDLDRVLTDLDWVLSCLRNISVSQDDEGYARVYTHSTRAQMLDHVFTVMLDVFTTVELLFKSRPEFNTLAHEPVIKVIAKAYKVLGGYIKMVTTNKDPLQDSMVELRELISGEIVDLFPKFMVHMQKLHTTKARASREGKLVSDIIYHTENLSGLMLNLGKVHKIDMSIPSSKWMTFNIDVGELKRMGEQDKAKKGKGVARKIEDDTDSDETEAMLIDSDEEIV